MSSKRLKADDSPKSLPYDRKATNGTFYFKPNGLIKKTMSISMDGRVHHLVCYYSKHDATVGKNENQSWIALMSELRKIPIPKELIDQQATRKSYGLVNTTDLQALAEQEMQLLDDIEAKWSPGACDSLPSARRKSFSAISNKREDDLGMFRNRAVSEFNQAVPSTTPDISFVPVLLSSKDFQQQQYQYFPNYQNLGKKKVPHTSNPRPNYRGIKSTSTNPTNVFFNCTNNLQLPITW